MSLRIARKLAKRVQDSQRYTVVAICSGRRGEIISTAINSYSKSHPAQAKIASALGLNGKIFLHAEFRAILAADRPVHKISVYRFLRNGQLACAKPCLICETAIKNANIKLVEYTT